MELVDCPRMLSIHVWTQSGRVWRYQRAIRIRNSKDRQHNTQKKKDKQRSTKYYTQNWRSRNTISTKKPDELRCSGRVRNYCSTCDIRRVTQSVTCYFKALLLQALIRPNDMYCHNKEFKFPAVHCFLKSYCSFRYCDSIFPRDQNYHYRLCRTIFQFRYLYFKNDSYGLIAIIAWQSLYLKKRTISLELNNIGFSTYCKDLCHRSCVFLWMESQHFVMLTIW